MEKYILISFWFLLIAAFVHSKKLSPKTHFKSHVTTKAINAQKRTIMIGTRICGGKNSYVSGVENSIGEKHQPLIAETFSVKQKVKSSKDAKILGEADENSESTRERRAPSSSGSRKQGVPLVAPEHVNKAQTVHDINVNSAHVGKEVNLNSALGEVPTALQATDTCCADHNLCDKIVPAKSEKYGYVNSLQYDVRSCGCDDRFRMCLKHANSYTADAVGHLFFNVLKIPCLTFTQPEVAGVSVKPAILPDVVSAGADGVVSMPDEALSPSLTVPAVVPPAVPAGPSNVLANPEGHVQLGDLREYSEADNEPDESTKAVENTQAKYVQKHF